MEKSTKRVIGVVGIAVLLALAFLFLNIWGLLLIAIGAVFGARRWGYKGSALSTFILFLIGFAIFALSIVITSLAATPLLAWFSVTGVFLNWFHAAVAVLLVLVLTFGIILSFGFNYLGYWFGKQYLKAM